MLYVNSTYFQFINNQTSAYNYAVDALKKIYIGNKVK